MNVTARVGSITSHYLVAYDPAGIPDSFPTTRDVTAREPAAPPSNAVEELARDGRAVVIKIPQGDVEASIRVVLGETAEVPEPAKRKSVRSWIRVPSGELVISGSEFIHPPGLLHDASDEETVKIPAGDYGVEIFNLAKWKAANYKNEVTRRASRPARVASRILTAYTFGAVVLLVIGFFGLPFAVMKGWRYAALLLATGAVVIGSFWIIEPMTKRFRVLSEFETLAREFEERYADVVIVLSRDSTTDGQQPAMITLR